MNRNLASALAIASTAAVAVALAALSPAKAYADDITIDNTPFQGSRSRAEVLGELRDQAAVARTGTAPKRQSVQTREQARAEYKASRDYVQALNAEDSGSAYFIKSTPRDGSNPAATMGGPAR